MKSLSFHKEAPTNSRLTISSDARNHKNQLACIMFTDVVGCTSLMERNQQRALDILSENRALHANQIASFGGDLIKEMGDGILATFTSASAAVVCAKRILEKAKEIEGLELRIGIHLGEVVFKKQDVFGIVVNIASRLQEIAKKGQILVSESVANVVKSGTGVDTKFLGTRKLKNVRNRIKVYTIQRGQTRYGGIHYWTVSNLQLGIQRALSLAVWYILNGIN